MIELVYNKTDLRFVFIKYDNQLEMDEIENHFNKIPQYMFLPSFSGIPKPEVFIHKFVSKNNTLIYYAHSGLWKNIYDFCKSKNINVIPPDDNFKYTNFSMTKKEFSDYVKNWKLDVEPRDYQIKAAWLILKYRQSLSELATRAGKTLIAYIVFRYMLEHGAHNILMIVPSIHLVKQGVADMEEYQEFFKSETVWHKSELCDSSNLTIGTYQSLIQRLSPKSKNYNPRFFDKFDVVCVDEAHHLICATINTILNQGFMKNIKLKFGFTGTLPKSESIESFMCQSLMGPQIQNLKAIELIDEGFLATPDITQIYINYGLNQDWVKTSIKCAEYLNSNYVLDTDKNKILLPKEKREFTIQHEKVLPQPILDVKSLYEDNEYLQYLTDLCATRGSNILVLEQMLAHRAKPRLDIICDIIKDNGKNIIVFAHNKEYISFLHNYLSVKFPDKQVFKIEGNVNLKKRQKIVDYMDNNNNTILIASYGCCSTGITFKNVDIGIFAQSFKSDIVNKQSLGRLMLKTQEKDKFFLYDIIDVFPSKRLYLQGLAKGRTYKKEGYNYKKINLRKPYALY